MTLTMSGREAFSGAVINNVNIEMINQAKRKISENRSDGFEKINLDLEWNLMKNYPQIYCEVRAERTCLILESELQTFLGGKGIRPTPMQYFLYGIAASYLSTIMLTLSERNIQVDQARLRVEAEVDNAGLLGTSEIVKPIRNLVIHLRLRCNLAKDELLRLIQEAKDRCPAFAPVDVEIRLEE